MRKYLLFILLILVMATSPLYSNNRPLGLYNLRIAPNPFTPNSVYSDGTRGLRIMFEIDSENDISVRLTCKVYNLQGTLVKTIVENSLFILGNYTEKPLYWDGTTDDKRQAQNGRYLVHLIVEDIDEKIEYLQPVVMVK